MAIQRTGFGYQMPRRPATAGSGDYSFADQTNDAIMPYWNQARQNMKAQLADQGMLSSSAGLARYNREVEQPYAQAANTMYADLQKQARAEQFQQQQANVRNSQNLYNLLWSAYLNMYQLGGAKEANKVGRPNQFPIFGNVSNAAYQQPLSAYLPQNVGDPAKDYVSTVRDAGQSLSERSFDAEQSYKKAYLDYLNRSLSAASSSGGGSKDESDPWGEMTSIALQNTTSETPLDASRMLAAFEASYGVDIEGLAAQGDKRAAALLELLGKSTAAEPTKTPAELLAESPYYKYSSIGKGKEPPLGLSPQEAAYAGADAKYNGTGYNPPGKFFNQWVQQIPYGLAYLFSKKKPDFSK